MNNAHGTEDQHQEKLTSPMISLLVSKVKVSHVLLPEQDGLLRMIIAKLNEYFEESATQAYLGVIRILVPPLQTIFFFLEHPVYLFRQLQQLFGVLLDCGLFAKFFPKFFGLPLIGRASILARARASETKPTSMIIPSRVQPASWNYVSPRTDQI
jgi:hypothetical protein